jgi:hypothetical protein
MGLSFIDSCRKSIGATSRSGIANMDPVVIGTLCFLPACSFLRLIRDAVSQCMGSGSLYQDQ